MLSRAPRGKCRWLFLLYLDKNGRLLRPDGSFQLDDNALVALALLIAESKPTERDLIVRLVLGLLDDSGKATRPPRRLTSRACQPGSWMMAPIIPCLRWS
jgi:hypothetical protein